MHENYSEYFIHKKKKTADDKTILYNLYYFNNFEKKLLKVKAYQNMY